MYHPGKQTLENNVHSVHHPNLPETNMVLALYIDGQNEVWVAPNTEKPQLLRYDRETDTFFSLQIHIEGDLSNFRAYAMIEDSSHRFWIGTRAHGLCLLDRNTGHTDAFFKPQTAGGLSLIHEMVE